MVKTYDDKAFIKLMNPPTNIYYFFSTRGTIQVNTEELVVPISIDVEKLNILETEKKNIKGTPL